MKLIISLLILTVALFGSIGKITSLKGDVTIKRGTQSLIPKKNFSLQIKDEVITKQKSRVRILFNDKTSVTVGKNSTFKVEEFFENPIEPKKSKLIFKLGKGIFRTISGKIGKMNRRGFRLKTKSASIGIRGSDGTTIVNALGKVKHLTTHGAFVMTDNATGKLVDIVKGTTGVVSSKGISVAATTKADLAEVFNLTGDKSWFDIPKELIKKKKKKTVKKPKKKQPVKTIKPLDKNTTKVADNNLTKPKDMNLTKPLDQNKTVAKKTIPKVEPQAVLLVPKKVAPKLKLKKSIYSKKEISLNKAKKTINIPTHTVDTKEVLLKVQKAMKGFDFGKLAKDKLSAVKHRKRVSNIQQNLKELALYRAKYEQNGLDIQELSQELKNAKKRYERGINRIYKQNAAISRYAYLIVVAKAGEDYQKSLDNFVLDKYAIKKYDQTTTLKKSLASVDMQSQIKTQKDFGQKSVDVIYDYIDREHNTVMKIIKVEQNPFIKSSNSVGATTKNADEQFEDGNVAVYDIQNMPSYKTVFQDKFHLNITKIQPFLKAIRENINMSAYKKDFNKNSAKIVSVLQKLEKEHIKQATKIANIQNDYEVKKDLNKQILPLMDKLLKDTKILLKPYNIKLTKETIGNVSLITPKLYSETVDHNEEMEFILRKVKSYISKINISDLKQSDTLIDFADLTSEQTNKQKMIKFDSLHILPYLDIHNKIGLLVFSAISVEDKVEDNDLIKFDFKYDSMKFVPVKKGYKTLFVEQTEMTLGIVKEFLEKNSYKKYFDQYCIDESYLPEEAKNYKKLDKKYYRYPAVCFKVDKIDKFLSWVSKKTKRAMIIPDSKDWGYVASNSNSTDYCWGDESPQDLLEEEKLPENIYLDDSSDISTIQKVASYPKSKSGLYDMCGNLFELTKDDGELTYKGNSFSSYIETSDGDSEEYSDDINPALGLRLFYIKDLKDE